MKRPKNPVALPRTVARGCAAIRAAACALLLSAALPLAAQTTSVATTFTGTAEDFPNPERGLAKMWTNLTDLSPTWLRSIHDSGYRVVSHRQLLSSYVDTPTLPQSFLDALNAGAALHRATGTKMVMQFSYDNVGGGPEPTLTTILGHIAQLKPFFTANADVIVAVHGGFLGTWGEWGFSTEPSVGNPAPSAAARLAVRDALLAAVPATVPIGWRDVSDLMAWYPTPLSQLQSFTGTGQARSGVHNDCFLNNPDDSGTYWASGVSPTGRTPADNQFRAYHAQVSDWTTTGGETCGDGQYKACADVLTDGALYHWRYLRDDWGTVFFDSWKAEGCYPEIKRSLGYRFQLGAISHPQSVAPGSVATVAVDLRNVGWSRIFGARKLVVTFRNRISGASIAGGAGDMRLLPAQADSSTRIAVPVEVPADAAPGDYDVYISMPDIGVNTRGVADYAVRFANADDPARGQAWEAADFRFKTGTTLRVAATAQTSDTTPPSTPAGLAAAAVSPSQINLTWNAATDDVGVAGYRVFRDGVQVATTAAVSISDQGLSPATAYSYAVAAYDAAGNVSQTSASVSATTSPAPDTQAPSVPTGLAGTALSSTQIKLTWNPSTDNVGVVGYYVYLNDVALATTTSTSFTHSGLNPGTTYNYRVSAYDAVPNHSAWTATPVSVTTPPAPDTQAPSVPTGLVGMALSSTQIKLTWNPSTDNVGVVGYYVYLNDVALATTTSTSFTHSGLKPGTTYNYRVSAYDAVPNHSAWTATPVSVTTPRRAVRGDLNSDGRSDVVWRNRATGENAVWLMNGAAAPTNTPIDAISDLNWFIAGVGDFSGDGDSDILWRNATTGQNGFFLMNGAAVAGIVFIDTVADLDWVVSGVGDFDGDGRPDILWHNRATGENGFFLMNGTAVSSTVFSDPMTDLHWKIAGVGDFDGDGKSDILWRHGTTGELSIWFMNGATITSRPVFGAVTDLNWVVAGIGDFDGDGKSDILWHNKATGSNTTWQMSGTTISGGSTNFATVSDLNWDIAGVGDFDGDGKSDILWRNGVTGENGVWFMSGGATILGQYFLPVVANLDWTPTAGR